MHSAILLLLAIAPLAQVSGNSEETVAPKRPLVIILDNSRESRILESELTRDWAVRPSAELAIWEARRKAVAERVKLVRLSPIEAFRVRQSLPAMAWGEFGTPESIDSRFFAGSGTALTCIEIHISNFDLDLTKWKTECENITSTAQFQHAFLIGEWVRTTLPEEWASVPGEVPFEPYYYSFVDIQERFGHYDGCPQYAPPELPPSPIRKFPWESK